MPKLPDLGQAERPIARQSPGIAQYRGATDGLGVQGEALNRLGGTVVQAADDFAARTKQLEKEAERELERQDTLRAEDAFTRAREVQLDLTIGEENGFSRLRGGAAANRPLLKEWGQRFDDKVREIEGGLTTDRQRELFRKRVNVSRLQFNEDILRHQVAQGDVYEDEVFKGTLATEIRNATAKWDSANDVGLSIARIEDAVKRRGDSRDWSPEIREAVRLEQLGKVHNAVVQQALATGNYLYAQQWYEQNKADIDVNTAKAVQKAVEDGTQKHLYAGYQKEFLGAENNPAALKSLRDRIEQDGALDELRKNTLVGRIQGQMTVIENRQRAEYDRRIRTVGRMIDNINTRTLSGFEPNPEQVAPIIAAAKGTELEADAREMITLVNATRAFRLADPLQQENYLSRAEGQARNGQMDPKLVTSFRQIYESNRRAVNEAPITFAVRQGLVKADDPAVAPLDFANPAQLGEQLSARYALGRAVSGQYRAPFKPLTPEEQTLASAYLKQATVEQKRQWFNSVAQASGGDFGGYRALVSQIAPDDPVTAMGGIYAGRGYQATDGAITAGRGRYVADLIFSGQALLNPNKKEDGKPAGGALIKMPSGKEEQTMAQLFNDASGNAFAGLDEMRSVYQQTARAIYARLSSDAADNSGILNSDRWKQAINLATGGFAEVVGKKVPLPYGMDASGFRDGLAMRIENLAVNGQLPKDMKSSALRGLPLEVAGDGRYVFRSGDSVLLGADGKPLLIDFNQSLPFVTSGGQQPDTRVTTKRGRSNPSGR